MICFFLIMVNQPVVNTLDLLRWLKIKIPEPKNGSCHPGGDWMGGASLYMFCCFFTVSHQTSEDPNIEFLSRCNGHHQDLATWRGLPHLLGGSSQR